MLLELLAAVVRVLSRIFGLGGGEDIEMTVDGGCSFRPQFYRGVWGHVPPESF